MLSLDQLAMLARLVRPLSPDPPVCRRPERITHAHITQTPPDCSQQPLAPEVEVETTNETEVKIVPQLEPKPEPTPLVHEIKQEPLEDDFEVLYCRAIAATKAKNLAEEIRRQTFVKLEPPEEMRVDGAADPIEIPKKSRRRTRRGKKKSAARRAFENEVREIVHEVQMCFVKVEPEEMRADCNDGSDETPIEQHRPTRRGKRKSATRRPEVEKEGREYIYEGRMCTRVEYFDILRIQRKDQVMLKKDELHNIREGNVTRAICV